MPASPKRSANESAASSTRVQLETLSGYTVVVDAVKDRLQTPDDVAQAASDQHETLLLPGALKHLQQRLTKVLQHRQSLPDHGGASSSGNGNATHPAAPTVKFYKVNTLPLSTAQYDRLDRFCTTAAVDVHIPADGAAKSE